MVSSLRIQICNFKFSGSFSSLLTRSHVHIFCAEAVNGSLGGLWLLPKTLAGGGGGDNSELWEGQTDAGPMGPCNLLPVTPGKSFQLSRFRFSFI